MEASYERSPMKMFSCDIYSVSYNQEITENQSKECRWRVKAGSYRDNHVNWKWKDFIQWEYIQTYSTDIVITSHLPPVGFLADM